MPNGDVLPTPLECGLLLGLTGARLHLLDSGPRDGAPAVLIHGLGSRGQEMTLPLRTGLEAQGWRVLAVDRPGYGDSDLMPKGASGPAGQARRLRRSLAPMLRRPPLLIAHSLGAAVAVHLALQMHGAIAGLVLVNPFARPTPPAAAPLLRLAETPALGPQVRGRLAPVFARPIFDGFLKAAFSPDPVSRQLQGLPASAFVTERAALAMIGELRAFNDDMRVAGGRLHELDLPAAVITGLHDRGIDGEAHGDWLAAGLPRASRTSLPGGHMQHHVSPGVVLGAAAALA